MQKFIKIDAVLNYISSAVRKEDSDMNLLSSALQIYKELSSVTHKELVVEVKKISDHSVDLPSDFSEINYVSYLCDNPCEKDESEMLCAHDVEVHDCNREFFTTRTENICRLPLNYQLFLESNYHRNNFMPLKYKGRLRKGISTSCIETPCQEEFWTNDSQIVTTIKEGYICVVYTAHIKSEGKIMIPNDPTLLRGLAYYAEAKHAENRAWMKEESMANMAQLKIQQAEGILNTYRGKILLRGIDLKQLDSLTGLNTLSQKLLRYAT